MPDFAPPGYKGCVKNHSFLPLLVLLLCAILIARVAAPHLHLCVDGDKHGGSALHLADAVHSPGTHPHDAADREIELKPVGDLRLTSPQDDNAPWILIAVVLLLIIRIQGSAPRVQFPGVPVSLRAYRLLPPSHAPPVFL